MVGTWTDPDHTAQSGQAYKINIDSAFDVAKITSNWFAVHEQASPDMTVRVESGFFFDYNGTITSYAAQNSGTITAPTTNPRIDRILLDPSDGSIDIVTGSEAASPSAPAITAGKIPLAQISLSVAQATIENTDITDERVYVPFYGITLPSTLAITGVTSIANGTAGAPSLSFTSDPDTGIYRSATNEFGISANGTEVATFSTAEVELNSTLVDINANAEISGTFDVTGDATFKDTIFISDTLCRLVFNDTNNGSNEKNWMWWTDGNGTLNLSTTSDASPEVNANNAIAFYRTGTTVDEVQLDGTTLDFNGNINSSTGQVASAWCTFDGTGSDPITIDEGYNVTNVTKNGTGDYTVNFTNNLSSANYSVCVEADRTGTTANLNEGGIAHTLAVGSVDIRTGTRSSNSAADFALITVTVFSKE